MDVRLQLKCLQIPQPCPFVMLSKCAVYFVLKCADKHEIFKQSNVSEFRQLGSQNSQQIKPPFQCILGLPIDTILLLLSVTNSNNNHSLHRLLPISNLKYVPHETKMVSLQPCLYYDIYSLSHIELNNFYHQSNGPLAWSIRSLEIKTDPLFRPPFQWCFNTGTSLYSQSRTEDHLQ